MLKQMVLVVGLALSLPGLAVAETKLSVEDQMIASTIKSLAKAYVATADLEKLKKKNIEKVRQMDSTRFRREYEDAYETLKDLPPRLKARFAIREIMTKEQAIANIASLDKKVLYETIDQVPDRMVAEQVRLHLSQDDASGKPASLMERVTGAWNKMVKKIGREEEGKR